MSRQPDDCSWEEEYMFRQQQEIDELNAMVTQLTAESALFCSAFYISQSKWIEKITGDARSQTDKEVMDGAKSFVANVKADAIDELANTFIEEWPAHTGKYDWMIGTAIMMRKTMITTSSKSSLGELVNKINEEL